ncbi:DUF2332 domain-containing protein [Streptomyces radicis]|uniref:DUF2332 domain-containing protein n=1 Tax=Streptomyces radicis TaxID=1750517 RepID=A0A3A9WCG4_9ACTN|nr:DUF2332 domain-containing protein [Streptomyces radicis]RKN03707.1 DUF2332 domain-containing protein [Streptomyces radicis]RKN13646.1 DUF2332 domain-containing protein [Streptomyces radicis]
MPREPVARIFAQQAEACARLGSPLYAALLERAADDIREGGPCAAVLAGYEEGAWGDALPLRLTGAVHALALTGRAPGLAEHYPSAGGVFSAERPYAAWPAFREVVAAESEWIREWLRRPPQTNEVGRANLLLAGLLYAVPSAQLPVRLFELGSSAGLNLRAEQFRYTAGDFAWGPPDSTVRLSDAWDGEVPDWLRMGAERHQALRIVERRGCDLTPIDPLSADGSLALRAYVWPDQRDRFARLDGALSIAAKVYATVESAGAAEFLSAVELEPGTLTVVWHSVMRQYVPADEWAAVERELDRLAAASGPDAGFAVIRFEPGEVEGTRGFWLSVRSDKGPERPLALAHPHGVPARWPTAGG